METVPTPVPSDLQTIPEDSKPASGPPGSVSLENFSASKPLFEADSCLEFLILSLCNNFSLRPKQAAGLLVQDNKYLKRVMAKGLKSDFGPVQLWYQDIYSNTERLSDLLKVEKDGEALKQVLSTLKTGFECGDKEVQIWTCRLLSKLTFDFEERGLTEDVWTWFTSAASALPSLIPLCLSPDLSLAEASVDSLHHMSQGKVVQLFTLLLRDQFPNTGAYLQFVATIMENLLTGEGTREELIDSGVITYWTELSLREAENILGESRLTAFLILHRLWMSCFSTRLEEDVTVQAILTVLKRGMSDHMEIIRTTSTCILFAVLEELAVAKSLIAPGIYKALTLKLVEEPSDSNTEYLILMAFKKLIGQFPSIPLTPLVNILAKKVRNRQYQVDNSWTIADIDLFVQLSKHERLSLQHAVQLIDVSGRIYLSDGVYARAASVPISLLVTRFLDAEAMQTYVLKFCKIMAVALVNFTLDAEEELTGFERKSRVSQKNMHLSLMSWFLQLGNDGFTQKLATTLSEVNSDYMEVSKVAYPGLKAVLDEAGYSPPLQAITPDLPEPLETDNSYQIVPVSDTENHHHQETEPTAFRGREDTEPRSLMLKYSSSKGTRTSSFPYRRVLSDIERVKKGRLDRELKLKAIKERVEKEAETRRKNVKQQLEIRKIEQGLSRGIEENDCSIYPFGSAGKLINQSDEFQVREFTSDEQEEMEMVRIVRTKYFRVFKALFQKYSGTGFAVKKEFSSSFDWFAERKARMTEAELGKVLVLFKVVPNLLSKEDVRCILRSFCAKIAHQHELSNVDFEGFIGVMAQIAYFAGSRAPGTHSNLPAAIDFKQLMLYLRDNCPSQGISLDLFDEPDPGAGDKDVVRQLNSLFKSDPETVIPSGYKLAMEQDVELVFRVPETLDLPKSHKVSMEILDEILGNQFGIHVLEGLANVITLKCVKGAKAGELPPVQERSALLFPKHKISSPEIFPHHALDPVLKLEVAKMPQNMKPIAQECAQTLEDMLISISLGLRRVIHRSMTRNQLRNLTKRVLQPSQDPVTQSKDSESWKTRAKEVHARMLKNMEEKLSKQKKEQENERLRKEAEAEEAKKEAERCAKEKETRAKLLKEWAEKKEAEKLKKEEETSFTAKIIEEKRKKEREQGYKQLQGRLSVVLQAKQEQWRVLRETALTQPAKTVENKVLHQQRAARLLQLEKEKHAQKLQKAEELKSFFESESIQALFRTYSKQIEVMFRFFCKKADFHLQEDLRKMMNRMRLQDYAKMAVEVKIVPGLVNADVNAMIFKTLLKAKTPEQGSPVMMEETEFRQVLLQITDLAREKLNSLCNQPGTSLTPDTFTSLLTYLQLTQSPSDLSANLQRIHEENSTRNSKEKRRPPKARTLSNRRSIEPPSMPQIPLLNVSTQSDLAPERKSRDVTPEPLAEMRELSFRKDFDKGRTTEIHPTPPSNDQYKISDEDTRPTDNLLISHRLIPEEQIPHLSNEPKTDRENRHISIIEDQNSGIQDWEEDTRPVPEEPEIGPDSEELKDVPEAPEIFGED